MKTETIKIYNCDFCSQYRKRKWAMENHEFKCWKNPANKFKCMDCKFLQKRDYTLELEGYWATNNLKTIEWFCKKRKVSMYSHMAENTTDLVCELEANDFEKMPLECDKFESGYELFND